MSNSEGIEVSKTTTTKQAVKRKRDRPKKIRTASELTEIAQKKKNKLSLSEKLAIKLKLQREKDAAKAARGETEPKNKDRFYCTNKELQAELIKWRDSNIEEEKKLIAKGLPIDYTKRVISEELGKMFIHIAEKLLNHSSFRNYKPALKEDMKSQFYVKAIKGLKNYNFEFNNPFAFFTTAAWNSYLIVLSKNYKYINLRKDLMSKLSQELLTYTGMNPNSALAKCIQSYLKEDANTPE